ncbi:hypothetical protein Golax_022919 [Gossypium laxum]|uniref:DUF7745 domain-containing protein n=2 Tax=Gossypium TaxID=3633 RepID=A0A7J9B5U5_9ROSI|nr:hypothetical protein [Gossypium laxum]
MENGFLDKVEDNAAVRIWSEKMRLEKGDSLTESRQRPDLPKETNEHHEDDTPDMKKKVDVFALSIYELIIFPKALGHMDEAVLDLFDIFDKKVTPVPVILAETFRSLNACWRAGEGRFIRCVQLLLA